MMNSVVCNTDRAIGAIYPDGLACLIFVAHDSLVIESETGQRKLKF